MALVSSRWDRRWIGAFGGPALRGWSRVALALSIVVVAATSANLPPLVRPVEAGWRSDRATFVPALATGAHSAAAKAARLAGADDALPVRDHRLTRKRFKQWLCALTPRAVLGSELPFAGIVVALEGARLVMSALHHRYPRAPPASNQHA